MEPSTFQCDPQKLDALQIDPKYKQALSQFCADPKNASACEMLCETPPEMIEEKIGEIEGQLSEWQQEGLPPDMAHGLQQGFDQAVESGDMPPIGPEAGAMLGSDLGAPTEEMPMEFADGGSPMFGSRVGKAPGVRRILGSMDFAYGGSPRFQGLPGIKANVGTPFSQQMPPRALRKPEGIGNPFLKQKNKRPPVKQRRKQGDFGDGYQVMAAKGEMIVPNDVLNQNEGEVKKGLESLMEKGGYNPDRFEVGNSLMKKDRKGRRAAFSLAGILGGVVGFAAGGPAGAALGAAAGTYVETGDIGESVMMGLGAYGLSGVGVGMGWFGEGTSGFGGGLTSFWTDPGSEALGGMFAKEAPVQVAKQALPTGTDSLKGDYWGADVSSASTSTPVPTGDTISSKLAGSENIDQTMTKPGGGILDGITTDKALKYGLLGSLAYGMVEPDPVAKEPTGTSYTKEYDDYVSCVNSDGSNCQKPATLMSSAGPYAGIGTTGPGQPFTPITVTAAAGGFVPYGSAEGVDDIDARLGLNEFVFTADAVRGAGNGDVIQGAYNLYDLMDSLEGVA